MADERDDLNVGENARPKHGVLPFVIVALLMGLEGVGVFLLARVISPNPVTVAAAESGGADGLTDTGGAGGFAEIELAECRPSNRTSGKFVTFHVRVSALVLAEDLERAERIVRANRARLEDGVNTVIRRADLNHLNEPDLQTLKRHLKHSFDRIFGDDQLVKEVLIPQFLQSGSGL